jgi:Bacterial SH3 domain
MRRLLTMGVLLVLAATSLASAPGVLARVSQASGAVVVIKPYGAAVHAAPSSDADIYVNVACGSVLRVLDSYQGWYNVQTRDGTRGWVGGVRVGDANRPPRYTCTIDDPVDGPSRFTVQMGDYLYSYVQSGCLSLRYSPSRQAPYDYCVSNFHQYVVTGGPLDVDGEDWFSVWSASTGDGWSLAQFLSPDCSYYYC